VRIWRPRADLRLAGTQLRAAGERKALITQVANGGGGASRATFLAVTGATVDRGDVQAQAKGSDKLTKQSAELLHRGGRTIVPIPPLAAGKHAIFLLDVKPLSRSITLSVVHISTFNEQSYDNNTQTVLAPGDARTWIVNAALTGVAQSNLVPITTTAHCARRCKASSTMSTCRTCRKPRRRRVS